MYSSVRFDSILDRTLKNTYIIDDIVTFKNNVGIPCIHELTDLYGLPQFGLDTHIFPSSNNYQLNGSFLGAGFIIYFFELRFTRVNWQQEYRIDAIVGNKLLQNVPFLLGIYSYFDGEPDIFAKQLVECINEKAPENT